MSQVMGLCDGVLEVLGEISFVNDANAHLNAKAKRFLQVVEFLISAGANVSAVNRYDSRLSQTFCAILL